jgi:hypothetical protein
MKINKIKTKLISFHCGTNGMEKHSKFINSIDSEEIKIINCYTKYNTYEKHMPDYLYYVIQYREIVKISIFEIICNFVNKIFRLC